MSDIVIRDIFSGVLDPGIEPVASARSQHCRRLHSLPGKGWRHCRHVRRRCLLVQSKIRLCQTSFDCFDMIMRFEFQRNPELHFYAVPCFFVSVFAFLVAHCMLTVYEVYSSLVLSISFSLLKFSVTFRKLLFLSLVLILFRSHIFG